MILQGRRFCTASAGSSLVETTDPSVTLPPGNRTGVDPQLGPLPNNGGVVAGAPGAVGTEPARTHLLLAGSPAINAGSNPDALSFDQRGPRFPRVVGGQADMGAVESTVAATAIPVLGPWSLAILSAIVGLFGVFRRRR